MKSRQIMLMLISPVQIRTNNIQKQPLPHDHAHHLCTFHEGTPEVVAKAIDGALKVKSVWENLPWSDRAAIFLKAADLVSGKYRYKLMAATMLGQGKNAWQAEIDAAAEVSPDSPLFRSLPLSYLKLSDFFRFGVQYVQDLYVQQPQKHSPGSWKCAFQLDIWNRADVPSLAALSTDPLRASSWLFHPSTLRPLVVTSLEV